MTTTLSRDAINTLRLESGEPITYFDLTVEWILSALLIFMPLAFGVVAPWSEEITIVAVLAISVCLVCKHLWRRDASGTWSWAFLPILLFLLLAVTQLVSLPAGLVKTISPQTFAMRHRLLGDMPNAQSLLQSMSLSFYPPKTRHDLIIVLIASSVFAAVLDVYKRPAQIVRLLTVISLVGGAIAVLALLQVLTQADSIYWLVPTGYNRATGGTFVNYSNFSQFMNLSIGASVGLLLLKAREGRKSSGSSRPRRGAIVQELGDSTWQPVWVMGIIAGLGMASVLLSLSRGGVISLLSALVVTSVLVGRRQRLRAQTWALGGVGVLVAVMVVYTGFESLYERMASLERERGSTTGRAQVFKDISNIVGQFPVTGIGLGAHEYVYPYFDRSTNPLYAEHADSDYFQLAEEMGFVGLAIMAVFLGLLWTNFYQATRPRRPRVCYAAYGLGFGVIAVMVHGMTDFGQHLPAVGCLTAATCGLLFNLGRLARAAGSSRREQPEDVVIPQRSFGRRAVDAVPAMVATLSLVWGWQVVNKNRLADDDWERAQEIASDIDKLDRTDADNAYITLLSAAESAANRVPDNVEYSFGLNSFRWRAISRVSDPETGGVVISKEALGFTERIVDELQATRLLCPTFAPVYSLIGQLEVFVLNRPTGAIFIQTGYELGRTHPTVVFAAAVLDATQGKWDEAMAKFRRCLVLDQRFLPEILEVFVRQEDRPDLAVVIASEKAEWLVTAFYAIRGSVGASVTQPSTTQAASEPTTDVAATSPASMPPTTRESAVTIEPATTQAATTTNTTQMSEKTRLALDSALEMLKKRAVEQDAPASTLGAIAGLCLERGEDDAAILFYRKALDKDYGVVEWHYGLAVALRAVGKLEDAMKEVRLCLRLKPEMPEAQQLLSILASERVNRPATMTSP